MRSLFVKALDLLKEKRLCVFAGLSAIVLFVIGSVFFLEFLNRTDLIPFLDTPDKNTIVFSAIAVLFLVAVGTFAANVGKFSFASYVIVTFFSAVACYAAVPSLEIFNNLDLTDGVYVAASLNASYGVWWKIFLAVYICSLICGLIINRKHVFPKKLRNDAKV